MGGFVIGSGLRRVHRLSVLGLASSSAASARSAASSARRSSLALARSQDCRRVDRDERARGGAQRVGSPAESTDPCRLPEQRLSGRRAEADDELGPDGCELELEPVAAGRDLRPVRLLVDAPLPGRTPLEVLHRVRHVRRLDCDAGLARAARASRMPGRPTNGRPARSSSRRAARRRASAGSGRPRRTPSGSHARRARSACMSPPPRGGRRARVVRRSSGDGRRRRPPPSALPGLSLDARGRARCRTT